MKAYKLTDGRGQTHGCTQWGENVTHETNGVGELCGPGWLHFYDDPYLAVLFNPIHATFDSEDLQLWEAEAGGRFLKDKGLKYGCTHLTTLKRLSVPDIPLHGKVEFAIQCARQVYEDANWKRWALGWLSGKDRGGTAAYAAANAAYAAAYAADAATYASANTADAAATAAAYAATYASAAANTADANTADHWFSLRKVLRACSFYEEI